MKKINHRDTVRDEFATQLKKTVLSTKTEKRRAKASPAASALGFFLSRSGSEIKEGSLVLKGAGLRMLWISSDRLHGSLSTASIESLFEGVQKKCPWEPVQSHHDSQRIFL
jgi:hypothetical protein